jgi:hypothetical protein
MAKGNDILQKGIPHVGEKYIYGVTAPKNNNRWKGPWDCAEFISWCVYQATGKLYGCDNDHGNPATADAYTGFWQSDVSRLGIRVSVELAAKTPGAIVLRYPIAHPRTDGHIVISDGRGGTVEAKSRLAGVVKDVLAHRRWDTGVLIPGVEYGQNSDAVVVTQPNLIFRLTSPLMRGNTVKEIQRKLKEHGIDPGGIDGAYGADTIAAVIAFQRMEGLVVDGEVGTDTAQALGVESIGNL